jgi:hypothetical protein
MTVKDKKDFSFKIFIKKWVGGGGGVLYCSWIFNYLCNEYLSTLKLWVWILLRQGVLDSTLCDKVCQWLATDQWFSQVNQVSSTNKTDCHDLTEILLKVALNTIILALLRNVCRPVQVYIIIVCCLQLWLSHQRLLTVNLFPLNPRVVSKRVHSKNSPLIWKYSPFYKK